MGQWQLPKIDTATLVRMIHEGFSRKECAEYFKVKVGSVNKAVARLRLKEESQPVPALSRVAIAIRSTHENAASDQVRQDLGQQIQHQIEILKKNPPTRSNQLAGRNGFATVIKTLADSAATVFDWSNNSVKGLVITNLPEPKQIEKTAKVQELNDGKSLGEKD